MDRPSLILLVGVPGAGKTTYAQQYIAEHPGTIHLSSDEIRRELWGSAEVLGDSAVVFSLMQTRAVEALNKGQNVVYDATNINRTERACIISRCPESARIECYVIWAPVETCVARDTARARTVGRAVIDRMLQRYEPVRRDEGIHEIKIIKT